MELALDELPDEQREVFVAHELEGRSFKELSAESGVNINTLLARKRYAVLHLRERLQNTTTSLRTSEEPEHETRERLIWIAPLAIMGMLVFAAIGGQVVMLLWNWLAPELFGLRLITFWQALGLLALCRILFGGFGMGGGSHRGSHSRRQMRERWEQKRPTSARVSARAFMAGGARRRWIPNRVLERYDVSPTR